MNKFIKFFFISVLSISIINAYAENVQIDKFGFENQPLIFKTTQELPNNSTINWDFGDNNKDTGQEVIHRYNNLGEFEVSTQIKSPLYSEDIKNTINIVKESAIILTEIEEKQFNALNQFSKINDFYLEKITTSEINNPAVKNIEIKNQIENLNLEKFNYLIIWSNNPNELDFIYSMSDSLREKLQNKNLIYISDDISNIYLQRKISNLNFKNAVLAGKESIYDLIELKKYELFIKYIEERDYKFINIDKNLVFKKSYLILTIITDTLIDAGLNPELMYLILLIPILFGLLSVFNNIIGVSFINKYTFVTFIIGSIVGSIEIMIVFYLLALLLALINRLTLNNFNLLKIPKENLNIGVFATTGLILIFLLNYYNIINDNQLNTYTISLIVSTLGITPIFSLFTERKLFKKIKIFSINLLFMSLLAIYFGGNNLYLSSNYHIKQNILNNPEIIILFIFLNFIAMIYSGLRFTEYITYKKIYENLEE